MGVYHLMGLGRSPGAITGPLSYLSHRYQRWNTDDQRFFSRSGEVVQRRRGDKVGDVQALILFTTREVLTGQDQGSPFISYNYIENPPGRTVQEPEKQGGPMARPAPDVASSSGSYGFRPAGRSPFALTKARTMQRVETSFLSPWPHEPSGC